MGNTNSGTSGRRSVSWLCRYQTGDEHEIATIALASALTLTGTVAFAQTGTIKAPSAQGAPTGAAVDSMGSSTAPGAVKQGTSAGGAASFHGSPGVTTGAGGAMVRPGTGASEQGAPTSATVNSRGDATQPGAVKQGTSTSR